MPARIAIVNNQDEIIGHKERGTLAKSDIYRVSALWVTNPRGDILLTQRKLTEPHNPGQWHAAVAGTVEEGETYESNIIKEAAEEIGLANITPTPGPKVRVSNGYDFFCHWYFYAIDKPAEAFDIQEEEVEQIKWIAPDALKADLLRNPASYVPDFKTTFDMFM